MQANTTQNTKHKTQNTKHKTQNTKHKKNTTTSMSRRCPTLQRLCRLSTWQHLPCPQIKALRLPASPLQAPGGGFMLESALSVTSSGVPTHTPLKNRAIGMA